MTVDFLWGGKARPTRGPKPALTLDRIADAAIAVADAEGLAAVTMQRVAADLGVTKMALYRYLPGKAELVAAMLERGIGPAPSPGTGGWRGALSAWTEALTERYRGHRWALEATAGARPVGPNELGWMEAALRVLPDGLTGAERMDAVATLAGHARMIAGQEGESEFGAAIARALADHAERYPAVASAVSDIAARGGTDRALHFGLARVLDGLDVLLATRQV